MSGVRFWWSLAAVMGLLLAGVVLSGCGAATMAQRASRRAARLERIEANAEEAAKYLCAGTLGAISTAELVDMVCPLRDDPERCHARVETYVRATQSMSYVTCRPTDLGD